MGKVIYIDQVRKPAKPQSSSIKDKRLFIGGRYLNYEEWRNLCIEIGSKRFKDGVDSLL